MTQLIAKESNLKWQFICKALPALLIIYALILYFPALLTPFWGDDYVFLQQARSSRLSSTSWWLPFYSQSQLGFWRPLSMDTYFRWVETYLGADVLYAHITNFILWVFASASVGFFAWAFAGTMKWNRPVWLGFLASGVYGVNGAHFLPVHWIAAVNSSILVFWTALALGLWILAPRLNFLARACCCVLLVVIQLLALLSKESSVLIPFLMLALTSFCWKSLKISFLEITAWIGCVIVCSIWFYFYRQFSGHHHDAYGLTVGANIVRNCLSLLSWILNVPREALRFILTGHELLGALWAIAVALPMFGFIWLSLAKVRLHLSQWIALLAFVGVAYAPYFLLAEQSYEYYAAVALTFPVIVSSYGLMQSERKILAVVLLVISSTLAIEGSRHLDYPALMGRTYWAEEQLKQLEQRPIIPKPLVVNINNHHRFYAIGVAGLSWRLGVPVSDIQIGGHCISGASEMLVEDVATGEFLWRECDSTVKHEL